MCPANSESAAKHNSGNTWTGDRSFRMLPIEAAGVAIRTKDSAMAARYRRVMRHRGHKKVVVAVGRAIQVLERQGYRVALEPVGSSASLGRTGIF